MPFTTVIVFFAPQFVPFTNIIVFFTPLFVPFTIIMVFFYPSICAVYEHNSIFLLLHLCRLQPKISLRVNHQDKYFYLRVIIKNIRGLINIFISKNFKFLIIKIVSFLFTFFPMHYILSEE